MRVKLKQNLPNVMHLRRTCMYVHYVHMHKIFNTSRYTHSSQTNKHTHTSAQLFAYKYNYYARFTCNFFNLSINALLILIYLSLSVTN